MLIHIYAVIPKREEREQLAMLLRHHNTPFHETTSHIAVDLHCVSYKTVEKLVGYFERFEATERGVTIIGDAEEVPHDSG